MHLAGTRRGNDGNRKEEMELGVVWRIDRAWFSPYGGGWDKKNEVNGGSKILILSKSEQR